MNTASSFPHERGGFTGYVLLWLAGLYLRTTILAAPPVAPMIKEDLQLGGSAVGMLTTLPTLLFAAFAILGALIVSRWGARNTVIYGLVLAGAGSALRGAAVGSLSLYGATFVMGAGIAAMQPALPTLVYRWYPLRIGFCTALYTNGLLVGEVMSSGLTLPVVLPLLGGSWRLSFLFWSLPAFLVALAFIATPRERDREEKPPSLWWPDWRDPNVWLLGLALGGASGLYFGTNAYLPSLLHGMGHSGQTTQALVVLNGSQLISSAILLVWSRIFVGRRLPLILLSLVGAVCAAGLYLGLAPVVLAGVIGLSSSFMLILLLALPPLLGGEERTASISAGMFTLAYVCAFVIPLVGGMFWEATQEAGTAFVPLFACMILAAVLCALLRMEASSQ